MHLFNVKSVIIMGAYDVNIWYNIFVALKWNSSKYEKSQAIMLNNRMECLYV